MEELTTGASWIAVIFGALISFLAGWLGDGDSSSARSARYILKPVTFADRESATASHDLDHIFQPVAVVRLLPGLHGAGTVRPWGYTGA